MRAIKQYANWPTIPQLYIKGEFVGGCDIMREMFQSGELAAMLSEAGVPLKSQARSLMRLGRDGPSSPTPQPGKSSGAAPAGVPRPGRAHTHSGQTAASRALISRSVMS